MSTKFKEIAPDNFVTIRHDDFQVCVSIMIGFGLTKSDDLCKQSVGKEMMEKGMQEMRDRGTLEDLSKLSFFNKQYIDTFRNDPEKIGGFVYDQLLKLYEDPTMMKLWED